MGESNSLVKRQSLRNNEYYKLQDTFDNLFKESSEGKNFYNLVEHISSERNILLAYRNIKRNKGSVTPGVDGRGIDYIKSMSSDVLVKRIQLKLMNYKPKKVKRVWIEKDGGNGKRPLGIPCIEDRIIQQCIKQVLEPICEAKFYNYSFGFRPNRSTSHAISRFNHLVWKSNLHYVVDVDIKGFFDNVNHGKLLKQMWSLGIRDKNLICIIKKILTAEIVGEGVPEKGTPQGGILSPLLSNIVLNELDWWIDSQWAGKTTRRGVTNVNKFKTFKRTNLKEVWIVRYADDFKILCRDYKSAQKTLIAVKMWLKERLGLDISPEKSKITNLRKNYSEFLGYKIKVQNTCSRWTLRSHMSNKSKAKCIDKLRNQIKYIQKHTESHNVSVLNSMIIGMHNYYCHATRCSLDFAYINYIVTRTIDIRLRHDLSEIPNLTKLHKQRYGRYNGKIRTVLGITLFPIYGCAFKQPLGFTQTINNYTKEGREIIHNKLNKCSGLISYLLKHPILEGSIEYNDNRISLMVGQKGKCGVTGRQLLTSTMECHHKTPKHCGGSDDYKNLIWLDSDIHKLVHATEKSTIEKYFNECCLDYKMLKKVNELRMLVGNSIIQDI